MSRTLTLPSRVYQKLARGAAERGMTLDALLTLFSDLVVLPDQPTEEDHERAARIDMLLEEFRAGRLNATDQQALNELIDADYQSANARADRLIRAKERRTKNGRSNGGASQE